MTGKLITLEGIDGSGKSTITKSLKLFFKGKPDVLFTREPTLEWTGEAVNRAIREETDHLAELFLFLADHANHLSKIIRPGIADNKIVISDRYSDSRYAYQGATLQGIIEHPLEWVMELHKGWTVVPDLTILFDVSPEIAVTRVGTRDYQTKFEKISFLEQVRSNYLKLVDMQPERFIVIDAQQEFSNVERAVFSAMKDTLRNEL
ncbi:MAG: dTMP kinase [ANME-2 cluster archaeon]|nr:dTMP kinase [ANME-2 cluster archaeon]MCL7475107.1 dTMP kinase [ANME-2 cluster archaeon]MDF1531202.1 dTMP kinase [ANME-2 cluster archaeon]MDW7774832.1 dTMP kinase [Methanosarcinales archaeon]